MSRSVHVENYSDVYWAIRDGAKAALPRIELKLTISQATSRRQSFYNFITALERDSERQRKRGNASLAAERQSDASTLRGYAAKIYETDGKTTADTKINKTRECVLVFVNRSLDPEDKALRQQLARQLSNIRPVDDEPLGPPKLDEFFTQPLEIKDDANS